MPAIASLRERAESDPLRRAREGGGRLGGLSESERRTVESLTTQIVNKLLHVPIVRMKEAAATEGAGYEVGRFGLEEHLFGSWGSVRTRQTGLRPGGASAVAEVGSRSRRPSSPASGCARPGVEIALVPITTAGDRDRTKPFGEIGERGVFVKELEEALLDGRIDVAVHSAKDMTSTDTEGLVVGAYPPREDPRDALCGASAAPGMRIGTASVRRRAQLLALEPTLSIEPLRGNIDTGCASAASAGSTRSCSPPAGSTGSGSPTRSAIASTPRRCFRRRARARSRSRCGGRGGARRRGRRPGDVEAVEARAGLRRRDRRRLPRAGRRVPRRRASDGAHRGPRRRLGRAPDGDDPAALAAELAALAA